MTGRAIYHAPSDRRRNLILTMSGAASSTSMRIEDQLTEALAWLLDHDPSFALRVASAFLEKDPEALQALEPAPRLGVSTQVRLPALSPELSHLRPDLSLTAPDQKLQLLVEVKVGSEFASGYVTDSGASLDQVSAYVAAWRTCDEALEAQVRRVGTLTVSGVAPVGDRWRAADLTWNDIAALIRTTDIDAKVAAVADDIASLIEGMFGPIVVPEGYLEGGRTLTLWLATRLVNVLRADWTSHPSVFKPHFDRGYVGGFIRFTTPAGDGEQLWIVVTAQGSDYAEPGSPASLWLCFTNEHMPAQATRAALSPLGFRDARDRAGYTRFSIGMTLVAETLERDVDEVMEVALAWATGLLSAAGFGPTG